MNHRSSIRNRTRGVALLMVLMIVLAVTIIATGFIARADVELASGDNMLLRAQMDHLANSALEHARGLLLCPQDASGTYWAGDLGLQLLEGSPDYYDVSVTRDATDMTDYCIYSITCEAYRLRNEQKVGSSRLSATLRLDPCIALWTKVDTTFRQNWLLHGDMRTEGGITNQAATASLAGDVFATQLIGACVGQTHPLADVSLGWPPVTATYITPPLCYTRTDIPPGTLSGNPGTARIWRCVGNLVLAGNSTVQGMLLVTGNLTVAGDRSRITAAKNLPALYVGGNLVLEDANDLLVEGLAVVDGNLQIRANADNVKFVGGFCLGGTITETTPDASEYGSQAFVRGNPLWTPGCLARALKLDGVDDYVQTSNSPAQLQLASDYTLALWVNAASAQKDGAGLVVKCSPDGAMTHWALQFSSAAPATLVVRHVDDGGNAWPTGIMLEEIGDAWRHLAVVRNGDTMTSYLDGALRNSSVWTYPPGIGDGHLNIGADGTAAPDRVYGGAIDDVRVYDRALVEAEIGLIRGGDFVANLIGHWRLDGPGSRVTILADPVRAAMVAWPDGINGMPLYWSPATGAFFRSIARQTP